MPNPTDPRAPLASIDMGSNSFRLEIAQVDAGHYRRIDYLKETVRLGAGLDAQGILSESAMQRGLRCLRGFAARLNGFERTQVRAVSTQTLREARNRNAFLGRAQEALGFPIEVISGREEARLIYAGVVGLQPAATARLVIDIGGRSTELILGQGALPKLAESFGVGSVSLSMRFFADGRFSEDAFRAAQVAAESAFEEALETFGNAQWEEVLGSSGTVGAVATILKEGGQSPEGAITLDGLKWCRAQCLAAGSTERLRMAGLKADRAAVVGGGLSILLALFEAFKLDRLEEAKGALRQGVILDMAQSAGTTAAPSAGQLRDRSVSEMQRRYQADTAQAHRVQTVAAALFAQLRADLDPASAQELDWACALHEVGMVVSHHDHHRHSAYLVGHSDAPGFSQSMQQRLADLVLGHRGGLRKVQEAYSRDAFAEQLLALRLAAIACHARQAATDFSPRIAAKPQRFELAFPEGWAVKHPRTAFLLEEEAQLWRRQGPKPLALLFED
jgi:exopolyphosphatase / guanosine-5'-triphosphate,3'-diphosphate pyrophosphatase